MPQEAEDIQREKEVVSYAALPPIEQKQRLIELATVFLRLVVHHESYDREIGGYERWNFTLASVAAKRQSILAFC